MKSVFKLSFVLLFLPITNLFSQSSMQETENYSLPERGICAHRGAHETHPENTIAAFKEAVRLGAQMIEFDVRMTKDNKMVVIHDDSVERTTNGNGLVEELTWSKIKRLDAGSWKGAKFKGEKVPSLKKALACFPKNVWLNVHLKGDEELGFAVATLIMSKKREHQVIIACNKESAIGVKKVNPALRICNMERKEYRSAYIKATVNENFSGIQLLKKRNNSSFASDLTKLRKKGVIINYFYGNNAKEVKNLFDLGIDFILTDKLESMLEAAETLGIKRLQL